MFDLLGCTIVAPPEQMSAIVRVESSGHQFAIGVVGHDLSRQPQSVQEARDLVRVLKEGRYNYSVGLAQVNQSNFAKYNLNEANLFDRCANLQVGAEILNDCYAHHKDWAKAYSCYYSGNAITGFRHGYVDKVLKNIDLPLIAELSKPSPSADPIRLIPRNKSQGGDTNTAVAAAKPLTLGERRRASSLTVLKRVGSQAE